MNHGSSGFNRLEMRLTAGFAVSGCGAGVAAVVGGVGAVAASAAGVAAGVSVAALKQKSEWGQITHAGQITARAFRVWWRRVRV